jgi:phage-related protein
MVSTSQWAFETLNAAVDDEVAALPAEVQARFIRAGELIQTGGLASLPAHWIKHLDGKIWELRLQGRDVIGRALYVTATGRRVVVLRAFVKKTQATPLRELELARQRMKDVQ